MSWSSQQLFATWFSIMKRLQTVYIFHDLFALFYIILPRLSVWFQIVEVYTMLQSAPFNAIFNMWYLVKMWLQDSILWFASTFISKGNFEFLQTEISLYYFMSMVDSSSNHTQTLSFSSIYLRQSRQCFDLLRLHKCPLKVYISHTKYFIKIDKVIMCQHTVHKYII